MTDMNEEIAMTTSDTSRRNLMKLTSAGVVAAAAGSLFNTSNAKAQTMPNDWDKLFPKSENVDHQKVTFRNRYGLTLSGDLYLPKSRSDRRLAALVVGGPFGAVKEQSSGLYAQTMAERGFATLAFDPSFTGESGGEPRNVASPDINTEDFSAAVDFLGLHPSVDRERIGVIGICGWGGMALNAVAVDKRVKAVVASTMYDMTRVMSRGYNDSVTLEQRTQTLEQLSRQRWEDAAAATPAYQLPYNVLQGGEPQFMVGDSYLRRLLVVGATAVLRMARQQRREGWVGNLLERKKPKVAAVALANKTARIAWTLMARQEDYKPTAA
ncbi:dienelactone hydrolase family protein [Caulobacter sp. NIBR2454]|uniref:alpha/beta hydrolase n=2 Tax=Caulobacter sp. NIBR2454 TaxID=3015996 RepID=UPI003FA4A745